MKRYVVRTKAIFEGQRKSAGGRGIGFELTYEQWLQIWLDSGHLHERGRRRGQYVMARNGDIGPYALGNVHITTQEGNNREAQDRRLACLADYNASLTDEQRERRSAISRATALARWARTLPEKRSADARANYLKIPIEKRREIGSKAGQAIVAKRKLDPEFAAAIDRKISMSMKGRPFTPEHRANLAAVNKRRGAEMTAARLKREGKL